MFIDKIRRAELTNDRLTIGQIKELIDSWLEVVNYVKTNQDYYRGDDPTILSGRRSDGSYKNRKPGQVYTGGIQTTSEKAYGVPDWRIPVSYAAKIVHTITGYMYKPDAIQIITEDKKYLEQINQIRKMNDGNIKNSELGLDQSIYGVAYEIVQTDGTPQANPIYQRVSVENGIPVYDYSLAKNMIAFIYYYTNSTVTYVTVYYAWGRQEFSYSNEGFSEVIETEYFFGEVPVAIYQNNVDMIGDFDRVKKLIDAYDYVVSDNINELERFAQAYLVLINAMIKPGEEHKVRENKVIHLSEQGAAQFLTKQINAEHIKIITELLRKEIHKQAHVIDFMDENIGGNLSGAAIDRLMIDMNNLANIKQIYFEKGLRTRLRLIGKLLLTPTAEQPDIDIEFVRDIPQDLNYYADWLVKTKGQLSDETRLQQVPMVKDVIEEIKRLNEQSGLDEVIDDNAVARTLGIEENNEPQPVR